MWLFVTADMSISYKKNEDQEEEDNSARDLKKKNLLFHFSK